MPIFSNVRLLSSCGRTCLIIGPSGSGKTKLFLVLNDQTARSSVTSLTANVSEYSELVQLVDLPSHPRLWNKSRTSIKSYDIGKIIMVIKPFEDSAGLSKHEHFLHAAELFRDTLSEISHRQDPLGHGYCHS
ncbi:hypothetical protein ACOME3_005280 [Neoechinorhynchus agilis]